MILLISALSDGKARQEKVVKSIAQPGGMNSYVCNAPEGAEHGNVSPAGQALNTELRKSWQAEADCSTLMSSSQRMRWGKRGLGTREIMCSYH